MRNGLLAPAIVAGVGTALVIGSKIAEKRWEQKVARMRDEIDGDLLGIFLDLERPISDLERFADSLVSQYRAIEPEFHSHSATCGARIGCPGC